jgi:hypothetical protein
VSIVLAFPGTRAAVANLFGFTELAVQPLPSEAPSPHTTLDADLDLGDLVTLDQAREQSSFPVSIPGVPTLGTPDAVYVRHEQGLESVSLVYRPRAGFPAAIDTGVGLLLTQYAGTARPFFEKFVDAGEPMTRVNVDGRWPGLYFRSPHQILLRSPDGLVHEDQPRLAAPTLVWVRGDVTFRLEAAVDLEQALAVASSMR